MCATMRWALIISCFMICPFHIGLNRFHWFRLNIASGDLVRFTKDESLKHGTEISIRLLNTQKSIDLFLRDIHPIEEMVIRLRDHLHVGCPCGTPWGVAGAVWSGV